MSVSPDQLNRAIDAARAREAAGYFGKVKAGDQRAASLFARLVAFDLNPSGSTADYGWLTKQPGESQVDGYAEDSIVFGANPSDLMNVVDLVNGAGAPNASIGGSVKERRPTNLWATPHALTAEEMAYLHGGTPPPQPPTPVLPGREEMMNAGKIIHRYYMAPEGLQRPDGLWKPATQFTIGEPDWEGIGAWLFDVYLKSRVAGKTATEAMQAVIVEIRHTDEWRSKHPGETP